MNSIKLCFLLLVFALKAQAQLVVTVSSVKTTGQKTIVQLMMTNNLAAPVESARAVCFLLDVQGKIIGQSSKWVIGGSKDGSALRPKTGTIYSFVITGQQPLVTTNLTSKVSFSRVVLEGGKQADIKHDVLVTGQ